jgi:monovalent cation:H+ antiporter-2, CPA2 family
MNVDTVQELRSNGIDAIFGDASHPDTLAAARMGTASTLIVSLAGLPNVEIAIAHARELNRALQILVRANFLREVAALKAAGADVVVSGEAEVALGLTAAMLARLGATPEQVDRERARMYGELDVHS